MYSFPPIGRLPPIFHGFLTPLRSVQIWGKSRPICRGYAFYKHPKMVKNSPFSAPKIHRQNTPCSILVRPSHPWSTRVIQIRIHPLSTDGAIVMLSISVHWIVDLWLYMGQFYQKNLGGGHPKMSTLAWCGWFATDKNRDWYASLVTWLNTSIYTLFSHLVIFGLFWPILLKFVEELEIVHDLICCNQWGNTIAINILSIRPEKLYSTDDELRRCFSPLSEEKK